MSKELNPSLKSLALQIALQLPDQQKEAISVLQYVREIGSAVLGRTPVHPAEARRIAANIAKLPELLRKSKRPISPLTRQIRIAG